MDRLTATRPGSGLPEFDILTSTVWDHGLAARAEAWSRRQHAPAVQARFAEGRSQILRDQRRQGDAVLHGVSDRLKRGYVVLDFELIPTAQRQALVAQHERLARYGRLTRGDAQSSTRRVRYNEPFARSAQTALCRFTSRVACQRLLPTFTYTAHYEADGNLPFHVDRAQCEVTLAICLDRNAAASGHSLLCLKDGDLTACAELRPGWGLIFRGRDLPHGRVTIGTGSDAPTVMLLHYVDQSFTGKIM